MFVSNARAAQYVERVDDAFVIGGSWGEIRSDKVVLATGGRSLPKTGSDGYGYSLVKSRAYPHATHLSRARAAHAAARSFHLFAQRRYRVGNARSTRPVRQKLQSFTNSTLCTHFGLSGPSVLDISRYYLAAQFDDPGARLTINWLPGSTAESVDAELRALGRSTVLRRYARSTAGTFAACPVRGSGRGCDHAW